MPNQVPAAVKFFAEKQAQGKFTFQAGRYVCHEVVGAVSPLLLLHCLAAMFFDATLCAAFWGLGFLFLSPRLRFVAWSASAMPLWPFTCARAAGCGLCDVLLPR